MNDRSHKQWTPREKSEASRMHRAGANYAEIGLYLHRSPQSVEGHVRWHNMDPSMRAERNRRVREAQRRQRKEFVRPLSAHSERIVPISVPDDIVADREFRYALAPRDLTAAFLGDPLPGYSALDRRASP